jgi:hypothetical protein
MKHIFSRKNRLSQQCQTTSDPLLLSTHGLTEGTQEASDPACQKPGLPTDPAVITKTRESALAFGKELIHALSADLRQGELSELEAIWELLPYHISVVHVANYALSQRATAVPVPLQPGLMPAADSTVSQYLISSRFLTECSTYLLADPHGRERLHMVTGLQIDGNRYTLDQMQKVAMSAQSAIGAEADQRALTRALIALTESGHALHGLFHSHPGAGPRATLPSLDKDIPTHQRLEQGGYPLIGAIFVPGYVRFFSAEKPFTVTIYGKGVTPVPGETHVYKIQTSPRSVSYETITAEE